MPATRSKSLTAIVILLVLLVLVSGGALVLSPLGFGGGGFRAGGVGGAPGAGSQANPPSAGNIPGGNGGGFLSFLTLGGIFRLFGINFQYMGAANLGVPIVGILLALIAALGLWMQKRWALYLAFVVGIVFLLGAFPSLLLVFTRFSLTMRTGMAVLNTLFALGVIILGFLPSTRKSLS